MTTKVVENRKYFDFLCDIIRDDRNRGDDFSLLLERLHSIEFYSLVPNDENRIEDGKKLRDKFNDEMAHTGPFVCENDPCTVLEMMIGLTFRMEMDLIESPFEKNPAECFWILVDNLNLGWCDNYAYYQEEGLQAINEKIYNLLSRNYDRNGQGGLFPLNKATNDQRRVEIWYQMSLYLQENYEF